MDIKKEEINPAYPCPSCRRPFPTPEDRDAHQREIEKRLAQLAQINKAYASQAVAHTCQEESGEEISHGYHLTTRPSPSDALEGLAWMADGTDRPWLAKHGVGLDKSNQEHRLAAPYTSPVQTTPKTGAGQGESEHVLPKAFHSPTPEPQIVLWRGRRWLAVDYSNATLAELLCVREAVCDADFQTLYVPLS